MKACTTPLNNGIRLILCGIIISFAAASCATKPKPAQQETQALQPRDTEQAVPAQAETEKKTPEPVQAPTDEKKIATYPTVKSLPKPKIPTIKLPEPEIKSKALPVPKPAVKKIEQKTPAIQLAEPALKPSPPKPAPEKKPEPPPKAPETKPAEIKPQGKEAETKQPVPPPKTEEAPKPKPQPTAPSGSAQITEPAPSPVTETKMEAAQSGRFELRFPGSGWVYLGDEKGQEGIKYESRRFEDSTAVFTFMPEKSGEYVLRFQRQNPLDKTVETNLVRVTVKGKEPPPQTKPAQQSPAKTPDAQTPPPPPESSVPPLKTEQMPPAVTEKQSAMSDADIKAAEDLLRFARAELDAKRVQSAIDALDKYVRLYRTGNDELYYLYALAYEQDTPFRDIKKSHGYYKRVRDEYPRSKWWSKSRERIEYLERYYFGLK